MLAQNSTDTIHACMVTEHPNWYVASKSHSCDNNGSDCLDVGGVEKLCHRTLDMPQNARMQIFFGVLMLLHVSSKKIFL